MGVFRCLLTMHSETNANKMHPRSSRRVLHFMCVYLQAQTTVHTHLMNQGYFYLGKNLRTPNLVPCRVNGGAGCRISNLYLCCHLEIVQTIWLSIYLELHCFEHVMFVCYSIYANILSGSLYLLVSYWSKSNVSQVLKLKCQENILISTKGISYIGLSDGQYHYRKVRNAK